MTRTVLAFGLLVTVALGAAHAQPAPPPERPSSFGATPEAPLPEVKPGDFEGLLRNCDVERTRALEAKEMAEKNVMKMPFLVAAYLALWAILMVFFVIVARRQSRLRADMASLRERLARLGDGAP